MPPTAQPHFADSNVVSARTLAFDAAAGRREATLGGGQRNQRHQQRCPHQAPEHLVGSASCGGAMREITRAAERARRRDCGLKKHDRDREESARISTPCAGSGICCGITAHQRIGDGHGLTSVPEPCAWYRRNAQAQRARQYASSWSLDESSHRGLLAQYRSSPQSR